MTDVVISDLMLERIGHLLTPGGAKLPSREDTQTLVEGVVALGATWLARGAANLRLPEPVTLPILGTVTHVRSYGPPAMPTWGAFSELTGQSLELIVRLDDPISEAVGARWMVATPGATADPSQPMGWGWTLIDGLEVRVWEFESDRWAASLEARREGIGPWRARCTRRIDADRTSIIDHPEAFEHVHDAFDALVAYLPSDAVPPEAWLPDSRLHAAGSERVRIPASIVARIAALLVPGDAPLPNERHVRELIIEMIRLGAPLLRAGHEGRCTLEPVTLPVFGAAHGMYIEALETWSTIAVIGPDQRTNFGITLENVGAYAEVRGAQHTPVEATVSDPVQWGCHAEPDREVLIWTFVIDGRPRTTAAERRHGATTWTSADGRPPGRFASAHALFEALVHVTHAEGMPELTMPDSRIRD